MIFEKNFLLAGNAKPEKDYQVIVAGGGPAGIGAALAAGLQGAETLILESRSQFGGTATAALWMCINWLFKDNQENSRGGVHKLLIDKIVSYGDIAFRKGKRGGTVNGGNLDIHPEYLKLVLFELFEELKIDYQLYSPVTDVIKKEKTLQGVCVTAREGLVNFKGNIFVDATGDGELAFRSGCQMVEGREEDGCHMPLSLVFALMNVEEEKLNDYLQNNGENFHKKLDQARKQGKYCLTDWYGFDKTTLPGVISVNNGGSGALNLEGTKSGHLTAMERLGLQIAHDFVSFANDYEVPGLKNCKLMRVGDYVSVRDTRRLVGQYVLTEEDIMEGREFEDVIARKYGAIDAVGFASGTPIKQGAAYPYRSLLPGEINNLLVAGRCGSATFMGHSGGKSMGNMISIGQGAGVAAAMAAKNNVKPTDLEVNKIQDCLRKMGVDI